MSINPIHQLALVSCLAMAACDSTFLGDAEDPFDNPFAEGQVLPLENQALSMVAALSASQRHPGILYAFSDEATPRFLAINEDGEDEGQLLLDDVVRAGWRDLATQNERLLLLEAAGGSASIQRFAEPQNPAPFSGSLERIDAVNLMLPDGDAGTCSALGAPARGGDLTLICEGNRLYTLEPDWGSELVQVAEAAGSLRLRFDIGELRDFSVSPGGQFGLLTGSSGALVAQRSESEQWGDAFFRSDKLIEWDEEDFGNPQSGSFAFNSVLTYLAGRGTTEGLLFAIFTP